MTEPRKRKADDGPDEEGELPPSPQDGPPTTDTQEPPSGPHVPTDPRLQHGGPRPLADTDSRGFTPVPASSLTTDVSNRTPEGVFSDIEEDTDSDSGAAGPSGAANGATSARAAAAASRSLDPARSAGDSANARLQRAALCGLLWHPQCQAAAAAAGAPAFVSGQIPVTFESVQQYVETFEPLMYEEARSGILNEWAEKTYGDNAGGSRGGSGGGAGITQRPHGWLVTVSQPNQDDDGWFSVSITPAAATAAKATGPRPHRLRQDTVVVLTKAKPQHAQHGPQHSAQHAQHGSNADSGVWVVAGIVRQGNMQNPMQAVTVAMHPACPAHMGCGGDAPCMQAVTELYQSGKGWHVLPVGNLVTHERECETLARVAQGRQGPMRTLLPMLLDPATAAEQCKGQLAQLWPEDFSKPDMMQTFGRWLAESYDIEQRDAIVIASSHLAPPTQRNAGPVPVLPFTLIQGPPGTGKTHTVKGILNVWYVIHYRRYHDAWRTAAAKQLLHLQETHRSFHRAERALELLSDLKLPMGISKPRFLICAPSNAATDELCERILTEGFRDLSARVTFPDVARVGSEDALMSQTVSNVWVESRIKQYLNMPFTQFQAEVARADARFQHASAQMLDQLKRLDTYAAQGEAGMMQLAGNLVDWHSQRTRASTELNRLGIISRLYQGTNRQAEKKMREELESTYMDTAELIFTTLSSTGRHIFTRLKKPFDAVLIDEACQAAEVATLQPLVYGTDKVVLVGDPKQLPATLFSRSAKETAMDRSLFERFAQAKVPVKLLAVQYRMHREIRQFPSAFFYQDQLRDAEQVVTLPPESFYQSGILKPYVVFDVRHGREGYGAGNRSKCNVEEARMAAALYWELRCEMDAAKRRSQGQGGQGASGATPPHPDMEIGVVTPYKSQRDLIRQTFVDLFGSDVLEHVKIETVDSFQGKQLDVVILSCVRAFATPNPAHTNPHSLSNRTNSIGFLADTRRLNVAITRAKRALWVLGQVQSLSHHNVWRALIDDARHRGLVVQDADANDATLVPRFHQHVQALQDKNKTQQGHDPQFDTAAPRDPRQRAKAATTHTQGQQASQLSQPQQFSLQNQQAGVQQAGVQQAGVQQAGPVMSSTAPQTSHTQTQSHSQQSQAATSQQGVTAAGNSAGPQQHPPHKRARHGDGSDLVGQATHQLSVAQARLQQGHAVVQTSSARSGTPEPVSGGEGESEGPTDPRRRLRTQTPTPPPSQPPAQPVNLLPMQGVGLPGAPQGMGRPEVQAPTTNQPPMQGVGAQGAQPGTGMQQRAPVSLAQYSQAQQRPYQTPPPQQPQPQQLPHQPAYQPAPLQPQLLPHQPQHMHPAQPHQPAYQPALQQPQLQPYQPPPQQPASQQPQPAYQPHQPPPHQQLQPAYQPAAQQPQPMHRIHQPRPHAQQQPEPMQRLRQPAPQAHQQASHLPPHPSQMHTHQQQQAQWPLAQQPQQQVHFLPPPRELVRAAALFSAAGLPSSAPAPASRHTTPPPPSLFPGSAPGPGLPVGQPPQRPVPAHAQLALPQSAAQNRGRVGIVIGGAGAQGAVNVSNTGNASKNSRQGPPAQQPPER